MDAFSSSSRRLSVADLFCGAGGTSIGMLMAARQRGLRLDLVAVNHWPRAIQTHMLNHPWARHICASLMPIEPKRDEELFVGNVDAIDPRKAVPGGKLDILIASPECTHHSIARGGRPRSDQSRATPWCILRWADALNPERILIENVPEFRTWGPLDRHGVPIKAEAGKTFAAFLQALDSLGYTVDHRILCAADYGDATTRKRLFIQATRGRGKVIWPDQSHNRDGSAGLERWRPAHEVIDWTLPSQSIFGRSRKLAPRTLERIAAGLRKFCGEAAEPFLIMLRGPIYEPDRFARSIDEPCPTITAGGTHLGLVEPFIVNFHGGKDAMRRMHSVADPLPTQDTSNRYGLCEPFVTAFTRNEKDDRNYSTKRPTPTITGTRTYGLVEPYLVIMRGKSKVRSVNAPCPTITCTGAGHLGLIEPFLFKYNSTGGPRSINKPLPTLTTKDRCGLVAPYAVKDSAGNIYGLDIHFRMLQPAELGAAMGFPPEYQFAGTKDEVVKQIGNAVPAHTACALGMEMMA